MAGETGDDLFGEEIGDTGRRLLGVLEGVAQLLDRLQLRVASGGVAAANRAVVPLVPLSHLQKKSDLLSEKLPN